MRMRPKDSGRCSSGSSWPSSYDAICTKHKTGDLCFHTDGAQALDIAGQETSDVQIEPHSDIHQEALTHLLMCP